MDFFLAVKSPQSLFLLNISIRPIYHQEDPLSIIVISQIAKVLDFYLFN